MTLNDRVEFLERYVTFRRSYEQLEFSIDYRDNDGTLLGGPSDWDIRVVAVVPENEIADWIAAAKSPEQRVPPDWTKEVGKTIETRDVREWFMKSRGTEVGVDRDRRVIAYRSRTVFID